jgi:hypothetical protein
MSTHAESRVVYELGQGSVRVQIVQTPYAYSMVEPVHYVYSMLTSEVVTNHLFDLAEIDELIHLLLQAKTFFEQRCRLNEDNNV